MFLPASAFDLLFTSTCKTINVRCVCYQRREKEVAKQAAEASSKEIESKAKQSAALKAQVAQERALEEAKQTQEKLEKEKAAAAAEKKMAIQKRVDSAKESTAKKEVSDQSTKRKNTYMTNKASDLEIRCQASAARIAPSGRI